MTCSNCGAANAPGDKFCPRCGIALDPSTAATPTWGNAPQTTPPAGRSEYIYGAPLATTDAIPPSPYAAPSAYSPPAAAYSPPSPSPTSAPPASPYGAPATPPYGPPPPYSAPTQAYTVPPPGPAWRPPDTLTPVARRTNVPLGLIAVLGALLLIGLAAAAVFVVGSNRPRATAIATVLPVSSPVGGGGIPPAQQPPASPVVGGTRPSDAVGRAIVAAIEANNTAQIAAFRNLDAKALTGKMSGKALQANLDSITQMQQKGQYEDARLLKIDYQEPRVLSAGEASIRTVEQWESRLYSKDGTPAQAAQTQTLYEVYYLIQQNGHWLVNQVDISTTPDGTPVQ